MLSIVFNFECFIFVPELIIKIKNYEKSIINIALGLGLLTASAQIQQLAGPRIGMTFITAGSTADFLHKGLTMYDDGKSIN